MTTISFAGGRGNAPGTYVYEQVAGSIPGRAASFNTIYVPVETDPSVNSLVFPFNTPVRVNSYREYLALLGNVTPVEKWQNLSLQYIEALFKMASVGDVRVIRLHPPASVSKIRFDPSANKVGLDVSQLAAGDTVYLQLSLNSIQLGESDSAGTYKGVPVTVPETYSVGQTATNRAISSAMAEAIANAILNDPEVNAAVYIRNIETDQSEIASLNLAPRAYGSELSVVFSAVSFPDGYVLASNGYEVENLVSGSSLNFYDYAQSLSALNSGDLPQGYLVCPIGFSKFKREERVKLGALMAEIASEEDKKWLALIDPGAYNLKEIEEYSSFEEHEAADGFVSGETYLINNHLVRWTAADAPPAKTADYVASQPNLSDNTLTFGERVSLRDNRLFSIDSAESISDTLSLREEWTLPSGTSVTLSPTASSTLPTGLTSQTYYVIANDVDGTLSDTEVKLASSFSNAIGNIAVDFTSNGVADGSGNIGLIESSLLSWDFPQTIRGVTGSYVECVNVSGTAFNLHHLPGTLQAPTGEVYFKAVYRRLTDPSASGVSNSSGDTLFTVISHGLSNKDTVFFLEDIEHAGGNVVTAGTSYLVAKTSVDTFKLAASETDYNNGVYVPFVTPTTATPVRFHSNLKVATSPGAFLNVSTFNLLKGRKYQLDVTNAAVALRDENNSVVAGSATEVRLTDSLNPSSLGDYLYSYLENGSAQPLTILAGEDNYFCVPTGRSDTGINVALVEVTAGTPTFLNSLVEVDYLEPSSGVPDSLWNVKVVTAFQLLDEGQRAGNVEIIETGVNTHARLLEDARLYSNPQGFVAYYGPKVLNDNGVWVPPTAWVTGLALRRYRDEGGFQSPPAGTKYALLGARDVQIAISTPQQDISNPYGLNALRRLPGYGDQIFVWGGRTRVDIQRSSERLYQFVNTRVIMNVLYGTLRNAFDDRIFSVAEGPAVVFNEVRSIANSVMYNFFADGYLFGDTANDAYQVIVDSRNNPSVNLENGIVNIQIFAVPATVTERIEIDLFRVAVGDISTAVAEQGF
jgi:hypothetical protein